jgi:hypothetical protein
MLCCYPRNPAQWDVGQPADKGSPMASEVFAEGSSNGELPEAQQATAVGQSGNLVTMTLNCVIIRGTEPEPIKVKMTSALAVQLAEQLLRAAAKSG